MLGDQLVLGGSSQLSPLTIGLWDPFQPQTRSPWLLTTYESWDDPPSRKSYEQTTFLKEYSQQLTTNHGSTPNKVVYMPIVFLEKNSVLMSDFSKLALEGQNISET